MQKPREHIRIIVLASLIAVLTLSVGALALALFGWQPPKEITIATGRKDGAYYTYAQEYQKQLAQLGYTLNIRETAGGIETIELLNKGEVDVGFVQNTVSPGIASPELATLAALYYEALWIFYREDLELRPTSVADLAGLRINIGEVGSATYETALSILEVNDLTVDDAVFSNYSTSEASQLLKDGELDVMMTVVGAAAPQVTNLLNTPGIQVLPMHRAAAYSSRFKNLSSVLLPEGVIDLGKNIPPQDTPMLAARATLVSGPSLHPDLAHLLLIIATNVHTPGGIFEAPNEFPVSTFVGNPMNADAIRFLDSGPTLLEAFLPLWLASRLERFLLLLVPLGLILFTLLRGVPSLSNQFHSYHIKRRYIELREIERGYMHYDQAQIAGAIAGLETRQEELINTNFVPTNLLSDLYDVHYHTDVVLDRLRTRQAALDQQP